MAEKKISNYYKNYNAGIIDKNGSLHIRGSRAGEVGIIDDGVFIRDELGGH